MLPKSWAAWTNSASRMAKKKVLNREKNFPDTFFRAQFNFFKKGGVSDFHSVSVSETSHSVNRQDDIAVADMVADIELDMVVDLRVF